MLRYVFVLLLISSAALAQIAPSPNEQALSAKLMQELQEGLSCNINLIRIKSELAIAQAKIKELEAKDKPNGN